MGPEYSHLDENTENVLVETHMVFAKDYGIDLTPNDQSMDLATVRKGADPSVVKH